MTSQSLITTSKAGPLLRQVLDEWERTARSPRAVGRANAWNLPGEPVSHLDEIVVRSGFRGPTDCDTADAYLLALVARAASDPLAARIVLQRLIPSILSIARRRGRRYSGGIDGAIGDLVTQAWFVISNYPVERRPRKVAANLVRDIEYMEYVAGKRPRKTTVDFVDHDSFTAETHTAPLSAPTPAPDEDDVHNFLIDLQMRRINPIRIEIMRLSCDGWTASDIARKLGLNERTARWHRANAIAASQRIMSDATPGAALPSGSAA